MIAATQPTQRPTDAKLLVVDNDAATLPASLRVTHGPTGAPVEVRLAGRPSLSPEVVNRFRAVVFGEGDFHTRTEDRPAPPPLAAGARLVSLWFDGSPDEVWAGLARHGRPIQYAHVQEQLALWDVWTRIAGPPVAFERSEEHTSELQSRVDIS